MSPTKRRFLDLLFGVQLIVMALFFGSRILKAFETVQGTNVAEQLSIEAFCLLNVVLALHAHRHHPSRLGRQLLTAHIGGAVLTGLFAIVLFANGYAWSVNDTVTAGIALCGTAVVIGVGWSRGLTINDPMVRGWIAVACKAIPHLLFGIKIWQEGSAGTPALAIVTGHIMILMRLTQIGFAVHHEGTWNRNRIGGAISDGAGEIAWTATTVIWLIR